MQTLIQKSKCERTKRKKFLFPVLLIQYSKLIIIKLFHFTNDLTKKKINFFLVNSTSNFERIAFYKIFETTHRYRYHYQIIPLYERFDKRKNFNSRERGSSFIGYFQRNIASICNRDEDLVWLKRGGNRRGRLAKGWQSFASFGRTIVGTWNRFRFGHHQKCTSATARIRSETNLEAENRRSRGWRFCRVIGNGGRLSSREMVK